MKHAILLLFLMSVVGQSSYGGIFHNPKAIKALKIGGGITLMAMVSGILWKLSHQSGVRVFSGDPRLLNLYHCKPSLTKLTAIFRCNIPKFRRNILGVDYAVFPVSDVIISGKNHNMKITIESLKDPKREDIVYILTYKPKFHGHLLYHPLVLNEAKRNKDKNFYMVHNWYSRNRSGEYQDSIVDYLDSEDILGDRKRFREVLLNLCNLTECPIKKENIRFLTLSDEVLSFEAICEKLNVKAGDDRSDYR